MLPQKGSVLLAADSGGIVGAKYSVELDSGGQRALMLEAVENDYLRPLVQTCGDALAYLKVNGLALIEVWALGVARCSVLTVGHPTLSKEQDGWLDHGIVRIAGELTIPAGNDEVAQLIHSWGRELAREAGIRAWEA
jgi:hypothetical protein